MAEEACAGNLQAGFCEEGPLQLRGPLLDAGGAIPPVYSPRRRRSCDVSEFIELFFGMRRVLGLPILP